MEQHQIVIIGGGTGGIMTAAKFLREDSSLDIAIVEPSEYHYYQPAWTLVGAGTYDYRDTVRKEERYIPKGATWIRDKAVRIDPENRTVSTETSGDLSYQFLVVSPGLVMAPEMIPGLSETLGKNEVTSVYTHPEYTWEVLQNFKGGTALFTQPATPIKCGGAPQKIMYLTEHYLRKQGIRDQSKVVFATPGSVIFGVEEFAKTLRGIIRDRDIKLIPFMVPEKIDGEQKTVEFRFKKAGEQRMQHQGELGERQLNEERIEIPFDMLHLAPPQKAPEFISQSPLAYSEGKNKGWMEVDINSLQHPKYHNVFGVGDVVALPTAKTGAAIRKQAPVVVDNILHLIREGKTGDLSYNGYSSCPLVTGYGKMVLAEFKYNNIRDSDPLISTFVDTTQERYSMWLLKKYGLPYLYWNQMLKGKMMS